MGFDVEQFVEQFWKICLASVKTEDGYFRMNKHMIRIVFRSIRMLQRRSIHQSQTGSKFWSPDPCQGGKFRVSRTDKNDLCRALAYAFQLAFQVQLAGFGSNAVHQTFLCVMADISLISSASPADPYPASRALLPHQK